eukprot:scaffold2990_cov119-Isochrysis_galbana.AAC.5
MPPLTPHVGRECASGSCSSAMRLRLNPLHAVGVLHESGPGLLGIVAPGRSYEREIASPRYLRFAVRPPHMHPPHCMCRNVSSTVTGCGRRAGPEAVRVALAVSTPEEEVLSNRRLSGGSVVQEPWQWQCGWEKLKNRSVH